MDNRLKFNKNNIPEEIDKLSQTIYEFSVIMSQKKKDFVISEKTYSELLKNQKEELKIKFAEIYKKLSEKDKNISDTKLKQFVLADSEYKSFFLNQKDIMKEAIEDLGKCTEEYEKAISNYYSAGNKRNLITDGIKLMIGGWIDINTEKIKEEYKKESETAKKKAKSIIKKKSKFKEKKK
jgi:hypothetical protein